MKLFMYFSLIFLSYVIEVSSCTENMPLFLKIQPSSQRRERLILGGILPRRRVLHHHHYRRPLSVMPSRQKLARRGLRAPLKRLKSLRQRKRVTGQRREQKSLVTHLAKNVKGLSRQATRTLAQSVKGRARNALSRQVSKQLNHSIKGQAKSALKQLVKSQSIQHAVKDVGRSLKNTMMPAIAHRLIKRPSTKEEEKEEEGEEEAMILPSVKRPRVAFNGVGYRGKHIQRGGTKQKGGFLF